MPWFRIDDNFYDHPKVDDLPLSAVGLWTLAGTYCAKQLTDGQITPSRIRKFGGTNDDVTALVTAGLWEQCADGYAFRNWHEYQPTRESVEADREKNRKRAQKWREKNRDQPPTSDNVTEHNAVTPPHEHVTNDVRTPAPTLPVPSLKNTDAYTQEFETFWKIYPRKKDKKPAYKAWKSAMKRTTPETATAAAQMYARDCKVKQVGEDFIKLGATWLNGDAWDNYQVVTATSDNGTQVPQWSKTECDQILGGEDHWVPGSPPAGLSIQEEREWKQARAAEHLNERRQQALEAMNRDNS